MSNAEKFELVVEVKSLRSRFFIEEPSEDQIRDILNAPEKFNQTRLSEDIWLQSYTLGLKRGDPMNISGRVDLYFDHKGKVYMEYEDSLSPIHAMLVDSSCSKDEFVEIIGSEDGEPFRIYKRSMVPVEVAIPFVLEFGKTGKIDVSSDVWERVQHWVK
ncbi:MAG: hypothetical protein P1U89_08395 [Verrucomicrobiales bacterium]|nr:hypothetical protein [Verrucomicrobiales bacterium]